MASDAWTMSTHEFRLLWESIDTSPYPTEFAYTGTEDIDPAAPPAGSGLHELTSTQREAMTVLCAPKTTIAVSGIDARRPFTETGHHLRIVSATGRGDHVFVARQRLAGSVSVGGAVSITRHSLNTWTRDVVAMLPKPTGRGSLSTDTAVAFDWSPPGEIASIASVVAPQPPTAASAFAASTVATCGSIRVQAGTITDPVRPSVMECRYRDIPDDGRYLLIIDTPGAALPVDVEAFAKSLNRVVNTLRGRHSTRLAEAR
ncbi:hypothetical protein ASG12_06135 [Williamsia sp. Leaf354]|uniref:hypothetical protein n=1 Tax=Williamsia sp. Leaf354 TaxID=1736349 RepID=UPI0006F49C59|nr:hypothetical protein [Williamsia sp. Leaf354]KQS00475.1 hypothetical protein ASG12_06135 [Williamsia sp. Leaf354]